MAKPRVLVLRAPGTNCDIETEYAFRRVGGLPDRIHVNRVLQQPTLLQEYQILCIPGGFSYGDDIAAGRILAGQMEHRLNDALYAFRDSGNLILGICNGFQVLLKSGVLLPQDDQGLRATLTWNDSGRFEDRWVHTKVIGDNCVFLRGIEKMYLPIAHAEGKLVARNSDILGSLDQAGQLVLRYAAPDGGQADGFPQNPNGSEANVAGCCDQTGRVFGLMPHPERYLDVTNHPAWTRSESLPEEGEGCAVFRNGVDYFAD